MALSSASTAASPLADGPVAELPPGTDRAEPVVIDDVAAEDQDELAVPALLVPGGGGEASFAELPAPLGSLPELLRPPALAGPDGTPFTPVVPAPAEPALGEPTGLPLPADGPLAAPPAPPSPVCASGPARPRRIAIAMIDAVTDIRGIRNSPFCFNVSAHCWFRSERFPSTAIEAFVATQEAGPVVRKLIAFDDDTFDKLRQLGRDRMATLQELADDAFADLLRKHGIPVDLKDALRRSASLTKTEAQKNTGSSRSRKTES
jgi:hypothetical protein